MRGFGQRQQDLDIVRPSRQCRLIGAQRRFVVTDGGVDVAQVVMRVGVSGVERHGTTQRGQRLRQLACGLQSASQVIERDRVVRPDSQRRAVRRDRRIPLLASAKGIAQMVVRGSKLRPQADRPLQVRNALRRMPERTEQHAEQMPGIGVIGLRLQHLRIARLRLVQPTLLVASQTFLEQGRDGGGRITDTIRATLSNDRFGSEKSTIGARQGAYTVLSCQRNQGSRGRRLSGIRPNSTFSRRTT